MRPNGTTTLAYTYDQNGSRTQQKSSGATTDATTSYGYIPAGHLASVAHGNTAVTYGYDGAGRNLTTGTTTTAAPGSTLPSSTTNTTSVYDGVQVAQTTDPLSGTNTMLRDALGAVAAQSSVSTANPGSCSGTSLTPAWSLHDRAGSPIAQTTPTGTLTNTANYSDFGVQQFATTGWNAATGYTGEKTDPTTGLNLYLSRAYDPFAGSWLTADTFRGTATDSQTQNRYAFVGNNPTTHQDVLGFASGGLFGSIISFVTTVVKKVVAVGKKVVAAAQSVFNATAQLRPAKRLLCRAKGYSLRCPIDGTGKRRKAILGLRSRKAY